MIGLRRRWVTVWDDGTVDRHFFTYRFAEHRRWGINSTAAAMGSERTVAVVKADDLRVSSLMAVFQANPGTEFYGLDLAREAKVPGGSIYPTLVRLEERGYVVSRWAEKAAGAKYRRRLYRLATGNGRNHE